MKKIIGMATLAAALCGSAFAADSKIALQASTGATLATVDFDDSKNNTGMVLGGTKNDLFGIEYIGENAGAKISLLGNVSNLAGKESAAGTAGAPATIVVVDDYYGWVKFGFLKITAGEWDHRYASRVNNEESGWITFEKFKYGALKNGTQVKESDNLALWTESETAADIILDKVQVSFSTGTNLANSAYDVRKALGARIAYKLTDTAIFDASFVKYGEYASSLGVFANIVSIKDLNLVIGYSGAIDTDVSANSVNAVELRARYAAGALALTSHNNFSFGDKTTTVYNMINVAYTMTDKIAPALYAMNINQSGDASGKTNAFTVRPGVTFTAQKGATIDAGIEFTHTSPKAGDSTTLMSIPVVLRIKF